MTTRDDRERAALHYWHPRDCIGSNAAPWFRAWLDNGNNESSDFRMPEVTRLAAAFAAHREAAVAGERERIAKLADAHERAAVRAFAAEIRDGK